MRKFALAITATVALVVGFFVGVAPAQAVGSTAQVVTITGTCGTTGQYGDTCVLIGNSKYNGPFPTGLPVAIAVDPTSAGICTVTQTQATAPTRYNLTYNALGTCLVNATQAGDATYAAATPVPKSITVGTKALNISLDSLVTAYVGDTFSFTPTVTGLVGTDSISGITATYGALGSYAGGTTPPTAEGLYSVTPSGATFTSGSASNYSITYGSSSYLCLAPASARGTQGMCIEKVTTSPAARTVSFGLVNYTSGTVNSGTTIRAASYIKMPSSAQSTVSCTLTGTSGNMSMSYPGASGSGGGGSFSSSFSVSRSNNSGLLWVSLAFSSSTSTGKVMCNWDGTGATVGSTSYFSSVLGPSITTISPTSGASSGGTIVTITGTKILAGATVAIGGSPCTNVVVTPSTSLTCTAPAGAPGAVDVVVTNADGTTVTSVGGFTQAVTVKPANSIAPALTPTGTPAQGATLTSTPGTWDYQGDPTTTTVTQWQVCLSADPTSCVNIGGSTGATLVAGLPVAGQYVRTAVAATNDAGTTTAYSNIVGPVDKIAQTVTFTDPADTLWSATPVALVGSSSSGLPLTYSTTTPTVCTVNGASVTMVGAGTCSVTASQAGTVAYSAATPVTQTFAITQATQTITFTDPADRLYSATPFTLTTSSSSTLPVTVTSSTTGVCTVSGLSVTMVSAGTCTLTATQAGNTGVAAATPVSQSFDITQATQTITFADPADRLYSATPFTLTASSSSSLPVTVTSTTPAVCTVTGFAVTMKAAGTCTLTVSQAGNTGTAAATPITQDFVISKADQTLVLTPSAAANLNSGATQSLAVTGELGTGAVTYVATPSGPGVTCVLTGATLKATGAGTCTVVATVASDPFFNGDSTDPVVFTVNGANAVTYAAVTDKLLTSSRLTVTPTSSARLAVSLASTTPSVCTVTGLVITFVDSGLCTTVASQAGDATHFAATPVTRSFNVAAAPDAPVVNAVAITGPNGLPGGSAVVTFTPGDTNGSVVTGYKVIATASDGTVVTIPCTTSPCTVSGLLPVTPYVFTVTTVATAAGTPAPAVSAPTDPVTPATAQVITFVSPGDVRPGTSAITVAPTSSVSSTFVPTVTSSTTSVCTVSNNVVTILTSGACTLTATHPGGTFENSPYGSATASVTFNVTAAVPVVTTPAVLPAAVVGAPITAVTETFTRGTALIPATVAWKAVGLPTGLTINPNTGVITGTPTVEGLFSNIVVSLTDAGRLTGSKTLSMNIVAPPMLTAESKLVLAANVAVPTGTNFPAVQGTSSALTWSETGLTAVAGLSMSTAGVVSGTPTTPGTYRVTVSVTDGNSLSSSKVIAVTVVAPPQVTTAVTAYTALEGRPLTPIVNTSVKGGAAIPTTGAWTSADLPAGLRLDPNTGAITGSPDAAGSYTFTVTVTDANGISANKTITLTVGNPPVIDTRRSLPTYTLGSGAMPDITQTVTPGAAPIPATGAWSLAPGSTLPAGLAFNVDTGAVTGTPTVAGNYTFILVLTDGSALTDTAVYKLAVVPAGANKTVLNLPLEVADGVQVSADTYALAGTGESSRGLPVTYSTPAASDAVCYLDSQNRINIIGAGTCTVVASSGSGATLSTATQSFVVSKTAQALVVTAPGRAIPDSDPAENAAAATDDPAGFQLSAATTSGLPAVYTVVPPKDAAGKALPANCSVDEGGVVTWLYDLTLVAGKNGYNRNGNTCRVMISQPGDKNFDAVKPQFLDLVATHNANPSPAAPAAQRGVIKIPRKGGTFNGSLDTLTMKIVGSTMTFTPGSKGGYIGPITATVTLPYTVLVNGQSVQRTQVCVIKYGRLTTFKASDPMAFKTKMFTTTKNCTANADLFNYFMSGNAIVGMTNQVVRDRRFSTTYAKFEGLTGKGKVILPTNRTYTFNVG